MKIYSFSIVILLSFLSNVLTAQVVKSIYQTMDISDVTKQINFDFPDSCEIVLWKCEGKMMFETCVSIETSNAEILNLFIKEERYNIVEDSNSIVKTIKFATMRPIIKNSQSKIIKEKVLVRVYVPEEFMVKNTIVYKIDTELLGANNQ